MILHVNRVGLCAGLQFGPAPHIPRLIMLDPNRHNKYFLNSLGLEYDIELVFELPIPLLTEHEVSFVRRRPTNLESQEIHIRTLRLDWVCEETYLAWR